MAEMECAQRLQPALVASVTAAVGQVLEGLSLPLGDDAAVGPVVTRLVSEACRAFFEQDLLAAARGLPLTMPLAEDIQAR